jgi:hypothetical protein
MMHLKNIKFKSFQESEGRNVAEISNFQFLEWFGSFLRSQRIIWINIHLQKKLCDIIASRCLGYFPMQKEKEISILLNHGPVAPKL